MDRTEELERLVADLEQRIDRLETQAAEHERYADQVERDLRRCLDHVDFGD